MYGAYAVRRGPRALVRAAETLEWKHVLEDSGAKLLFVATNDLAEAARQVTDVDVSLPRTVVWRP